MTTYRVARCGCCNGWTVVDTERHRAVGTFPDVWAALKVADLSNTHRCLPRTGDVLICNECRVPLGVVAA